MSPENTATPARRAFTCRILWFAMMMANLMFALLAFILEQQGLRSRMSALPPDLVSFGSLIAVLIGIVGLALAWVLGAVVMARPTPDTAGSGAPESGSPAGAWAKTQTATVLASAIAEAVGIVGLLFFMLGLPFPTFLLFIAL